MKTEHFFQLTLVLISAFAGGYAAHYFGTLPDGRMVLEYHEYTTQNVASSLGNIDEIKIVHKDKELKGISRTGFSIINHSEEDIGSFRLYFEVDPEGDEPLFHDVRVSEHYPEDAVNLISSGGNVFAFEVAYLNRAEEFLDGINFDFYFPGSEPPEIVAKVGTKGISIEEYKFENLSSGNILAESVRRIWWLLAIYISFVIVISYWGRARRRLRKNKIEHVVNETIRNADEQSDDEKVGRIMNVLNHSPSIKAIWNEFAKTNGSNQKETDK